MPSCASGIGCIASAGCQASGRRTGDRLLKGYVPEVFWNRAKHGHPNGGNLGAGDPRGPAWVPFECEPFLGGGWSGPGIFRKPEQIVDMYYKSVGRGAGAVWNLSPPVGKREMEICAAVGRALDDALGHPLATTAGRGRTVELDFKRSLEIDHVVVQEDLAAGERVLQYVVEAETEAGWVKVGSGQSLGHKRIFKFAPVAATRVRLVVAEGWDEPVIRSLYVSRTAVRTPGTTPRSVA